MLEKVVRALLHMLRLGCPWRDLPCDGLSWRTVYGYFARWRDSGIWNRLLKGLARRTQGRICYIDASYVKVHGSGANPAGGQKDQAMGPSRGGTTTNIHALVDDRGRVLKLLLSAGNVADVSMAPELIKGLENTAFTTLAADKGYDSDHLRTLLIEQDIFPCFALNATRKEKRPFHRGFYRKRHLVENLFCVLKRQRRVSTRYDKLASSFLAFVTLAAIIHWISSLLQTRPRARSQKGRNRRANAQKFAWRPFFITAAIFAYSNYAPSSGTARDQLAPREPDISTINIQLQISTLTEAISSLEGIESPDLTLPELLRIRIVASFFPIRAANEFVGLL